MDAYIYMHHWSVVLQQFDYEIIFRKSTDHGNADALSRIPPTDTPTTMMEHTSSIINQFTEDLCDVLPITHKKIKFATARDVTLSKVQRSTRMAQSAVQQWKRKSTTILHTQRGVINFKWYNLWGIRVVIPTGLRTKVLEELHHMHTGIVKMKSLARLHVWWPGLDKDIEEMCKQCTPCLQKQHNPSSAPLHP